MPKTPKLTPSEIEIELRRSLKLALPFLIFMIAIPLAAFFGLFNVMGDAPEIWFQRSGSLVVMFGLLIEYTLYSINDELFSIGTPRPKEIKLQRKYRFQFSSMKYLGLGGAICGTLIWGYGDLLWLAIMG